jgi:hypothetical protein
VHGGPLTDVVQSQPPAARVPGRPERQQNDLICMAADLPESVHAAAQADTCVLGARQCESLSVIDFRLRVRTDRRLGALGRRVNDGRARAQICGSACAGSGQA